MVAGSALGSKTRECEASSLLLAIAACRGHNYSDVLQLVDGVNSSGSEIFVNQRVIIDFYLNRATYDNVINFSQSV